MVRFKKIFVVALLTFCSQSFLAQSVTKKEDKTVTVKKQTAKNSYKNSSINTITAKKDSLLNLYGTFDAARKAGAIAPLPKKNTVENKPKAE